MNRSPNIHQRDSLLLCDEFWNSVCLDSAYNDDDDLSICCNDEYASFADRNLDAFNRICTMARPTTGTESTDDPDSASQSPLTPRDFITSYFGTALGTPIPASPIDFGEGVESVAAANQSPVYDLSRPSSPKRNHIRLRTPHPANRAAPSSMKTSTLFDGLLQSARPAQEIGGVLSMLRREYDASILESDVMVEVVEGADCPNLRVSIPMENDRLWHGDESPVAPMTDAPMLDTPIFDDRLYSERMAHWGLQQSEKLAMSNKNNLNWHSQSYHHSDVYGPINDYRIQREIFAS